LGGLIAFVHDPEDQEHENPKDDVACDPPLREVKDASHASAESSVEDKKPLS